MGLRIIALAIFSILFCSDLYAQCPGGHFRIGPLTTNRSIGAGFTSQIVATACINLETTEELATIHAVVIADLSHAQALADRLVANLGSATGSCGARLTGYQLAISTATLDSGFGTPHFTVSFTLNMPVRFVVTPQKTLTLVVDKPTTDLPALIDGYVSSKIYQQAQAYAKVFRVSLPTLIPKEVFLFNPQLGDVTASYGNDVLSAALF
jgi:hypothetical protein